MSDAPLKLSARDAVDLEVLSSLLQDSIVPLSDMAYLRDERRFALAVSRFRWEKVAPGRSDAQAHARRGEAAREPTGERINCGVRFEGVSRVTFRSLDTSRRDAVQELSAVRHQDDAIILVFAGGGMVRLEVDGILCHLEDFGAPWPTMFRPHHGPDISSQD